MHIFVCQGKPSHITVIGGEIINLKSGVIISRLEGGYDA